LAHNSLIAVITNKAIYTYVSAVNKEECTKYVDIKCVPGYMRNDVLTHLYSDLKDIKLYFDGNSFIDKNGNFYVMKINY
jgi:hypothetical protein